MLETTETSIDPTARVAPGAVIGKGVSIGPYCVIGPNAVLGDNCRLIAQVNITGHTTIGRGTVIYPFASLGSPPQSVKYRGGPTKLVIGEECEIRENVTMNTGTEDDGGLTRVGNKCMFMVGSHVGHDCKVGNHVTLANNAVLGGHVLIEDYVFMGGHSAAHQFVRIGESAMIAGVTGLGADVIPFGFAIGQRGELDGLNVVGMRRRGYSRADIHGLRQAYRALFLVRGHFKERVEAVERGFANDPVVAKVVTFIKAGGSRPIMKATKTGAAGEGSPAGAS
jgi:UDP-N-acetylglucosamine acyltransferase